MVMSWVWAVLVGISVICAAITGNIRGLSGAVMQGAQRGVTLSISLAGSLCLWAGIGKVMEKLGLTAGLARLLRPGMVRLFPAAAEDSALAASISANICANFLGLGNAATPPGMEAARRLAARSPQVVSDELCRLVVLNTASIQLIPANVAALRSSLGCSTPFDILSAVWITSLCSAGLGLAAAWWLGRMGR